MDCEKKYKDALERARNCLKDGTITNTAKSYIEEIFPELKESEDERIRKEIINYFRCQSRDEPSRKDIHNKWIAWLEKQRKQSEQKPADKVEPKFKVGDIVKHNKANIICKVLYANVGFYRLINILGGDEIELSNVEKNFHLWTIQDAKDGDILASDNGVIILVKESRNSLWGYRLSYHCAVLYDGTFEHREFHVNPEKFFPSTKEQRDILFREMEKAGYEWDADKKELKKVEQEYHCNGVREPKESTGVLKQLLNKENPAWSNTDLISLGYLAYFVDQNGDKFYGKNKPNVVKWIQSLANLTAPQQEWSEEDEYQINTILHGLDLKRELYKKEGNKVEEEKYSTQYNWLKSLKNKYTWKPSEEQMDALETATSSLQSTALESLYNELKKLKEE